MNSSEQLRQYAIEWGQMANFRRNKENRAEWNAIADRYLRCAQWYDNQHSLADQLRRLKNKKKTVSRRQDHAHA
jgi:hypothetical protein